METSPYPSSSVGPCAVRAWTAPLLRWSTAVNMRGSAFFIATWRILELFVAQILYGVFPSLECLYLFFT